MEINLDKSNKEENLNLDSKPFISDNIQDFVNISSNNKKSPLKIPSNQKENNKNIISSDNKINKILQNKNINDKNFI